MQIIHVVAVISVCLQIRFVVHLLFQLQFHSYSYSMASYDRWTLDAVRIYSQWHLMIVGLLGVKSIYWQLWRSCIGSWLVFFRVLTWALVGCTLCITSFVWLYSCAIAFGFGFDWIFCYHDSVRCCRLLGHCPIRRCGSAVTFMASTTWVLISTPKLLFCSSLTKPVVTHLL